ncbi:glycoside hydrolase family 99-like domain-containing protein [Paeniroseomonas aquatica]|uniref:glycoside hydrolase family 99-like domain-containing protein n=1 Tax=Paeniroseomonas aquatica TaxID=373043 RepID=UPI003622C951
MLAFYLPQFHPIPENDAWWGAGFTEWTNVAKATPLFPGHAQPKLPADLGFYDLRVPEVRQRQAALARAAGIEGFCYWHYWFGNGRRILERPFAEVMQTGQPDFPFCLAWANQSWTGIWHGNPKSVLMEQAYPGPEDEKAHFDWCLPAFRDPRHVTVEGKPLFAIFAPHDLPDAAAFIRHWRRLAEQAGLPGLYFVAISNRYAPDIDPYRNPLVAPFDAVTQLAPQDFIDSLPAGKLARARRILQPQSAGYFARKLLQRRQGQPRRFDFREVVEQAFAGMPEERRFLPCVLTGWDNTPRSGPRGVVYEGSTPAMVGSLLGKAVRRVADHPPAERIVFLKAWNEWAEGNYVEPDAAWGHGFLDAIRAELLPGSEVPPPPPRLS